ncbi:MAG TPA: hypothetical protein VF950_30600 [Planctomycetota bacterium]
MRCDDASRALYAGESAPDLEIHLSACDECRLLAQDLAGLSKGFARARAAWVPSSAFRVVVPSVNWRRLAAAACLLLLPLAGAAAMSLRAATAEAARDLSAILEPSTPADPTDRQILATLFLQEDQP